VDDETLPTALQRKVLPRCAGVIRIRDRWFAAMIKGLPRDEEDKRGRIFCPGLFASTSKSKKNGQRSVPR